MMYETSSGASAITARSRSIRINFTRSGWRQFVKLNRSLGTRFIQAFILRRELAFYIASYEAAGKGLDTICQEVRYDDGVYLLLMRVQGTWLITDVVHMKRAPVYAYAPVYTLRRVQHGFNTVITAFFYGWRSFFDKKSYDTKTQNGGLLYV